MPTSSVAGVVRGQRNPHHRTLAQRLKRAREAAGLTRRALSLTAGLSDTAAAQIEAGRIPGIDTVEALARGLKVTPCWLAYGHEGRRVFREKVPRGEPLDDMPRAAAPVPADAPLLCGGVGARLYSMRTQAGLSLRALARAADMTPTGVSNVENGVTLPSVATVETLAKALKCSPCWLAYAEPEGG